MKEITELMINEFKLNDIDFMGYNFTLKNASFHHLIIPRRFGGKETIENGAILNRNTSHPYLHLIEQIDEKAFNYITSEMIDMNIKRYLDIDNLRRINDVLSEFEEQHKNDTTSKGKRLIKKEFIERAIRQNYKNII